jgi:hypothetical protein
LACINSTVQEPGSSQAFLNSLWHILDCFMLFILKDTRSGGGGRCTSLCYLSGRKRRLTHLKRIFLTPIVDILSTYSKSWKLALSYIIYLFMVLEFGFGNTKTLTQTTCICSDHCFKFNWCTSHKYCWSLSLPWELVDVLKFKVLKAYAI